MNHRLTVFISCVDNFSFGILIQTLLTLPFLKGFRFCKFTTFHVVSDSNHQNCIQVNNFLKYEAIFVCIFWEGS